jgi:hypothetical protein
MMREALSRDLIAAEGVAGVDIRRYNRLSIRVGARFGMR